MISNGKLRGIVDTNVLISAPLGGGVARQSFDKTIDHEVHTDAKEFFRNVLLVKVAISVCLEHLTDPPLSGRIPGCKLLKEQALVELKEPLWVDGRQTQQQLPDGNA
jgi:hypothetical protein